MTVKFPSILVSVVHREWLIAVVLSNVRARDLLCRSSVFPNDHAALATRTPGRLILDVAVVLYCVVIGATWRRRAVQGAPVAESVLGGSRVCVTVHSMA